MRNGTTDLQFEKFGDPLTDDGSAEYAASVLPDQDESVVSTPYAALFADTSSYLSAADNDVHSAGSTGITVAFWINMTSWPPGPGIGCFPVAKSSGITATSDWHVNIGFTGNMQWGVSGTGAASNQNLSYSLSPTVPLATDVFICCRYECGVATKIFVNGSTTSAVAAINAGELRNSAAEFRIGRRDNATPGNVPASTVIDEVAIFDVPIDDADVTTMYNAGAGELYSALSAGLLANLSAYYGFDTSVTADDHGSADLTASGTVTQTTALVS